MGESPDLYMYSVDMAEFSMTSHFSGLGIGVHVVSGVVGTS